MIISLVIFSVIKIIFFFLNSRSFIHFLSYCIEKRGFATFFALLLLHKQKFLLLKYVEKHTKGI